MHDTTSHNLLTLYTQIATLKLLPRTGWLQRGVPNPESVAEHTFGVVALALLIGDTIDGLDRGKLLAIAMLHDLAEALLSDLPASAKRFIGAEHKHAAERRALEEMLEQLPNRAEYLTLWDEYARGCSREARMVKGLDRIELLTQALAYERAGSRALGEFWADIEDGWGDEFPILRELATAIMETRENHRLHVSLLLSDIICSIVEATPADDLITHLTQREAWRAASPHQTPPLRKVS